MGRHGERRQRRRGARRHHGVRPGGHAAALSIGIVFAGFALGQLAEVKQIGVGMAVAVLLDVTVVRGLLLPAAMSLLGRRNWWPGSRRMV